MSTVKSRSHRHNFGSLPAAPASPQWSPKAGPSRIPLDAPVTDPSHADHYGCSDTSLDRRIPRGLVNLFDDDVDPQSEMALMLTKDDSRLAEIDENKEKMDAVMQTVMDPTRTLEERQLARDFMESLAVESQVRAIRAEEEARKMREYLKRLQATLGIQDQGIASEDDYEEYSGSDDGSDLEVYEEIPIEELQKWGEEKLHVGRYANADGGFVNTDTLNGKGKGKVAVNDIEDEPSKKDKGKGKAKADDLQCDCPRHRRERELCGQGKRRSSLDDVVTLPIDMDIDSLLAMIQKRTRYQAGVQSDATNPATSTANDSAVSSDTSEENPDALMTDVDKVLAMGEDQGLEDPATDANRDRDHPTSAIAKDAGITRVHGPKPTTGNDSGVSSKHAPGKTKDNLRRLAADNDMLKKMELSPTASKGMPTRSELDSILTEITALSGMGMGMPGLRGASGLGMGMPGMAGLGGASGLRKKSSTSALLKEMEKSLAIEAKSLGLGDVSGLGMGMPSMPGLGEAPGLGTKSSTSALLKEMERSLAMEAKSLGLGDVSGLGIGMPGMAGLGGASGLGTRSSTSALLGEMERTLGVDAAKLGMYGSMGLDGMSGLGSPGMMGLGNSSGPGKNGKRPSVTDTTKGMGQGHTATGSQDATKHDSGHKGAKKRAAVDPDDDDFMAEMERSISAASSGTLSELDKSIAMLSGGLKEFDVENLKAMLENSDDEDFDDESNWSEKVEAGSVASAESTDTVKGTAGKEGTETRTRNENENHLLTEAQAMDKGRAAKQNTAIDKNDAGEQTGTVDQTQGSTDGLRVGGSRDEIKDQADAHLSSADPLAQAGAAVGKQDEMSDCSSEDGTGERPRKRKRAEAEQA